MNNSQFQYLLYNKVLQLTTNQTDDDINRKILYQYQYVSYKYITQQLIPKDLLPKGILLMYTMGAGKTLPAIAISLYFAMNMNRKIIFLANKSVHQNYKNQTNFYIQQYYQKSNSPDIQSKMNNAMRRIKFLSLNSSRLSKDLDETFNGSIKNCIVVIDEAHNLFRSIVNGSEVANKVYNLLLQSYNTNMLFLSGTPIVNDPFEIVPCINLLKGKEIIINDYDSFIRTYFTDNNIMSNTIEMQNQWDLQNRSFGVISYSVGDKSSFPNEQKVIIQDIEMQQDQALQYMLNKKKEDEQSQGDQQSGKMKMGIVSTNTRMGDDTKGSYRMLTRMDSNGIYHGDQIISPKADYIVDFINKNEGIHIVYSQFLEKGLFFVRQKLIDSEYKQLPLHDHEFNHIKNQKHFAFITGEISQEHRDLALKISNDSQNKNGDDVKVVLISSAAAEGINFKNVRYVHIMEPYWNYSRIKQVIARAVRTNSHKELEQDKRFVQPIIYVSYTGKDLSTDQHLLNVSMKKEKFINNITNLLTKVSIDCIINNTDCIMCQPDNTQLYDEQHPQNIPKVNNCKYLQKELSDYDKFLYKGSEYFIVDKKPTIKDNTFGKQVYFYNKTLNAYIRITGQLYFEILKEIKNG